MTQTATPESNTPTALDIAKADLLRAAHNLPAESRLLALLVRSPESLPSAATYIRPEYLASDDHRLIYGTMLWAQERAGATTPALDAASLLQVAAGLGREAELTGAMRRGGLWDLIATVEVDPVRDAPVIARDLVEAHARRAAITALIEAAAGVATPGRAPAVCIDAARSGVEAAMSHIVADTAVIHVAEGNLDLTGATDRGIEIPHLPLLSRTLRGLRPGTLTCFAGRSGTGKSMLLQGIAGAAALHGVPVLLLDAEMDAEAVRYRLVSSFSGVPENDLRSGKVQGHAEAIKAAQDADARLQQAPLRYAQVGGRTPEQVLGLIRSFAAARGAGPKLVVYDYLRGTGNDGRTPEWQVLGQLATSLKDIAVSADLPIVTAIQANREALGMSHADIAEEGARGVGGSDRVYHTCDAFGFLRNLRENEGVKVAAEFAMRETDSPDHRDRWRFNQVIHVTKNRGGQTIEHGIPIYVERRCSRHSEVAEAIEILSKPEFARVSENRARQRGARV